MVEEMMYEPKKEYPLLTEIIGDFNCALLQYPVP